MNVEEKETLRRAYDLKGKREFLQFSPVTQSKAWLLEDIEKIHLDSGRSEALSLDDMINILEYA